MRDLDFRAIGGQIEGVQLYRLLGHITEVVGLTVESEGPTVRLGELCRIYPREIRGPVLAEVVGFRERRVLLMPYGDLSGVSPGCRVEATGSFLEIPVGWGFLGRVVNGVGKLIDGKGSAKPDSSYPVHSSAPNPLERKRIREPLPTGVRVIDGLLTCGKGQRIGIFSGSGVGKSTLLGMIARNTRADVNVIALVGERGREVKAFLEDSLGDGLKRSVVVVATSDQPALLRVNAAFVATAMAEYFRDQGCDVLLMMDSLTRFAMAQREIGLATGEPPATRGYTPSVFAAIPKLLERSGTSTRGTITGFYTVLVDGDDINEPITDTARGVLDGHIMLSREIASRNHYPAVDVLNSVSRLMKEIVDPVHLEAAGKVRKLLATYKGAEDLINIGAYVKGSNPDIDEAIALIDEVNRFLRQGIDETSEFSRTVESLIRCAGTMNGEHVDGSVGDRRTGEEFVQTALSA